MEENRRTQILGELKQSSDIIKKLTQSQRNKTLNFSILFGVVWWVENRTTIVLSFHFGCKTFVEFYFVRCFFNQTLRYFLVQNSINLKLNQNTSISPIYFWFWNRKCLNLFYLVLFWNRVRQGETMQIFVVVILLFATLNICLVNAEKYLPILIWHALGKQYDSLLK